MVIWVVSGYDALVGQFGGFASDYLGRYDLIVLPEVKGVSAVPQLSPELVESLCRDADVAEINPVMQIRARITNPNLPPEEQTPFGPGNMPGPPAGICSAPGGGGGRGGMRPGMMFGRMPALVGTKATLPPYKMIKGDWIDPTLSDRMEGVLKRQLGRGIESGRRR